jgi:dihydroorotate dehydrogenase (fumarate)
VSTALELSSPAEARLPRAWIALLRGRVSASLAGSTGVEDAADVAAYLLAGADVVMTTSSLLRHGPSHATVLLDGLATWMKHRGFGALADLRGLLRVPAGADQAAYERGGYLTAIEGATFTYQGSGAAW